VIVVDSGEDRLSAVDISLFNNLHIHNISSERSVCIQRNVGINLARSPWIFLCDDDMEPPADYLLKLVEHLKLHPETNAVSGLILQKESDKWTGSYPIHSGMLLLWKYFFQLSIWGPVEIKRSGFIIKRIRKYYSNKGNHLSKAGWPVITNFTGDYFNTPVYGLGASLIKKECLLNSPFDEVLDRHGIGDNYGVAVKFPNQIHVLNNAFVYHHQEIINRLQNRIVYFRRALALDYFRQTIPALKSIKKRWLLWSLTGNFFFYIFTVQLFMIQPALKAILKIMLNKNPYVKAALMHKK
jgi:glycosyltransferase involved in cell wall biosynthesis